MPGGQPTSDPAQLEAMQQKRQQIQRQLQQQVKNEKAQSGKVLVYPNQPVPTKIPIPSSLGKRPLTPNPTPARFVTSLENIQT